MDWVQITFWDRDVDRGSTKYVDPGPCLTWQKHGDIQYEAQLQCRSSCTTDRKQDICLVS